MRIKSLDKCINIVDAIPRMKFMEAVVQKMGNSLGVKIPIEKNKLSEMLNNINEQNIHQEIKTGGPVGKEIWSNNTL